MTKEQNVTVGNTTVSLVEENGVVTIKVQSEDAIVYMNDDIIWSIGNEREEFKHIPKNLHKYIIESGYDFMEYNKKEKETVVDTYVDGEQLSLYIPVNQNKEIHARFDLVTSVSEVKDYLIERNDEDAVVGIAEELETRFKGLEETVEKEGYKLSYSHSMGEWAYAWWDIVFKAKDFQEGSIRGIMKEVNEFNRFINKIRDDLGY